MRISGGRARGIPLAVPKGDWTRPATDGLRQSIFSSLGDRVTGARFLDLFAGSGAYGLEALSRGAGGGVFVEQNARAVACIRGNIEAVCRSLARDTRDLVVLQADARTVPFSGAMPDLIFVDPPYEYLAETAPAVFSRLTGRLAPGSSPLVILELPGEMDLAPAGWRLVKRIGKGRHQPTAAIYSLEREIGGRPESV
jgi:16S rRNA (guanine966-N2)-methyltransferase